MRTLALVTQKGGAGKSTLASCLAVAAFEAGERVCLLDMDPQATLTVWGKTRGESGVPVLSTGATKLPALLAALEEKGFTLAIIDTPGVEGAASAAAMQVADLCVIPSRPTAFDLWASHNTRKTLKEAGGEYVFLLNQCPPSQQSARVAEGVAALEAMGALASPLIQARVDFQEAARQGLGVTEFNPSGHAAGEIRALWSSLKRRISKLKPIKSKPGAKKAA